VLSIGVLLPGRAEYYLGTVANGVEDYYTGAGEAPGQWCGTSAARLGLAGEVDADVLHRVLEHADPATGERLTTGHAVAKVIGFDTTFCPPKSVSLLFGLGDPEVSNEVRNAHDAAVTRALAIYETLAQGRRGAGGRRIVEGEGFVGAAFRHRTSRASDPHLHTHVVIANLVHAGEDERWSALDGRPVFQWCRTIGHLYNAELRHELTRRLGVEWTEVKNGLADIEGVPRSVIDAFSTRRAEIEADLQEHGLSGAKAAQQAVYMTRPAKDSTVDATDLTARWRTQADALGFDADALATTLGRVTDIDPPEPGTVAAEKLFIALGGPDGLTARTATFGRREVIEAICDALPTGGRIEDILDLADGFLSSAYVVGIGAQGDRALQRRDGHLVPAGREAERYSTPEMITVEQRVLANVARRQSSGAGIAEPDALGAALAARPTISGKQEAMVRDLCTSGAGVDLVEGVAGSGKTFALAAAREAWTASGFTVSGACLAARTARRLEESAAIPSTTLDALLMRLLRSRLEPCDVVVVDEAAMVGTRKLERLLAYAESAGAKVVLIGDPCQLPEIDAGGAFVGLARRFGAFELTENRRQHEPWERDALGQLRHGDPDVAIDAFLDGDRIHVADTFDELSQDLVDHWWSARENGEDALMCAPTRRHVDELNQIARHRLVAAGQLHGAGQRIGDREFAVGDQVLALRNDRRVGVLNGDSAVIVGFDSHRREITAAGEHGPVVIPYRYAEQWLTHGYAVTIHKAQGATVDRTFVLADDTVMRQHLYTALSRGRSRNDLYMTTADWRTEIRHAPERETDEIDGLRAAVHRDGAQRLALDTAGDQYVPTNVLRAEEYHLWKILACGPRDPSERLRGVADQIRDLRHALADATVRRDATVAHLEDMGPLEKRLHPKTRTRLEHQRDRDQDLIDHTTTKIGGLSAMATELAGDLRRYRVWTAEHGVHRQRFDEIHQILDTRIEPEAPDTARVHAPDLDIGLGL
jgi:conjugative relaxase-like TrwC/TraI family protein